MEPQSQSLRVFWPHTDRGSDYQEFSPERKEDSSENRRQGQAIPLCQVPKAEPEAREDPCSLVLPEVPQGDRGGEGRNPSRQQAMRGVGVMGGENDRDNIGKEIPSDG